MLGRAMPVRLTRLCLAIHIRRAETAPWRVTTNLWPLGRYSCYKIKIECATRHTLFLFKRRWSLGGLAYFIILTVRVVPSV